MKTIKLTRLLPMAILAAACSANVDISSGKNTISLNTRAAESSDMGWPVTMYAIRDGVAVDSGSISTLTDKWTCKVGDGQWTFAAKSASPEYYGSRQMDIDDNADVSLVLSPAVAEVSFNIKGVEGPCTIEMDNMYTDIDYNGKYYGNNNSFIGLAKVGDAYVGTAYSMPSRSKLYMYIKSDGHSYQYIYNEGIQAGYKYQFNGTYKEDNTITGWITVGDWIGEKVIDFTFGATQGGSSTLTMSSQTWSKVLSAYSDSPTMAADIAATYSQDGYTDWHIPTREEAKLLRDMYPDPTSTDRYLCEDATYTFTFNPSGTISKAGSKTEYKLLLVR